MVACFHCGEGVPGASRLSTEIAGVAQPMCCRGCQAVAEAIVAMGLAGYYTHRSQNAERPRELVPQLLDEMSALDDAKLQRGFVLATDGGRCTTSLVLDGVTCAACVWLIESALNRVEGIHRFTVNYATRQAQVDWDPGTTQLSAILQVLYRLGFEAYPFNAAERQALLAKESRYYLRRLGISALFGMQVMMIATPFYFETWAEVEPQYQTLLLYLSLLLTLPVLTYSAQPFWMGAWRALRRRQVSMDVSIASGIALAFAGSVAAVVTRTGEVYFDSVTMFTTLLLGSRYIELLVRQHATSQLDRIARILPAVVTRLRKNAAGTTTEVVPLTQIELADRVLIRPGETIPVDGTVRAGRSTVNEGVLTGESMPVVKTVGDAVISGSTNIDSALELAVSAVGEQTFIAHVMRLIERGQASKPMAIRLANRVAAWFVLAVLSLAVLTAVYYLLRGSPQWLPATVAVLVISCPCALAMSTPTAMIAATATLLRRGVALIRLDALESLASATHVVFDKTGTLTTGRPRLVRIDTYGMPDESQVLALAAALEQHSEHPIACALRAERTAGAPQFATDIVNTPGEGISGVIAGEVYYFGSLAYLTAHAGIPTESLWALTDGADHKLAALASRTGLLAILQFEDELRSGARETVATLRAAGKQIVILSGDHERAVAAAAAGVGAASFVAGLKPDGKLAALASLQAQGAVVAVVGDGVNDAPMLAQADISITLNDAVDVAKLHADLVLIGAGIEGVASALSIALMTRRTVRQNLGWAIVYNVLALPLAMSGLVTPAVAALGMASSSLLVVANAARIRRSN